jgi:hypothetical protein
MHSSGTTAPSGRLGLAVLRASWPAEPRLTEILLHGLPRRGLQEGVALWRLRNLPNLWRGAWRVLTARALGIPHHYGALYLDVLHGDGSRTQLGLASLRVVTDTGATKIVDAMRGLDTQATTFKFHGFGTGATAEAAADTALVTELTTQYNPDNTRPTGSQTNNGAKVYRTVGTLTPDADVAITEHGVFHQAATGGGSLLDRSKFAAINLVAANPDSLQATYDFTVNSGG